MARRRKKSTTTIDEGTRLGGDSGMRVAMRRFRTTEILNDAPGRPSSRDLVRQEVKRRLDAGNTSHLGVLGHNLSEWLANEHPAAPQMSPRVVENNIRDLWQQKSKKH
jgi:hypothetical protein